MQTLEQKIKQVELNINAARQTLNQLHLILINRLTTSKKFSLIILSSFALGYLVARKQIIKNYLLFLLVFPLTVQRMYKNFNFLKSILN